MNISDLIDLSFASRLMLTLMHFLWQGSIVALLAGVGNVLLERGSARGRYLFHVAALSVMILCVTVTFLRVAPLDTRLTKPIETASVAADEESFSPQSEPIETSNGFPIRPESSGNIVPPPTDVPARPSDFNQQFPEPTDLPPFNMVIRWQSLERFSPQLVLVYFVGVGVLLCRLVWGTWMAHQLRRRAAIVMDGPLLGAIQQQSLLLSLRVLPRVAWCAEVTIPIVIGIFRPMILLPATAATGLSPDQLHALIMHELAHVRRYDLLVNLVQRIAESFLFFHPAVWYISRRVSCEREQACDELVVANGCERLRYADALVQMAELSAAQRQISVTTPATSLAASGANSSEFKRRVLKVLSEPTSSDLQPSRLALLIITALVLGIALMAPQWHRSILAETPGQSGAASSSPPRGLEFLKPYPKLYALSLDMTEPEFLSVVDNQEFAVRRSIEGDTITHHIGLGDGHTLLVVFDQDKCCSGIQRVRGEDDTETRKDSDRKFRKQVDRKSDPVTKYGDELLLSWIHEGSVQIPSADLCLIAILKDGTVIVSGDTNRNRDCKIQLTAAELDQVLSELDEQNHIFDVSVDGANIIQPGQPFNRWDHGVDWLHIRRGTKLVDVGVVDGHGAIHNESDTSLSTCREVIGKLGALINVTRAGGLGEIRRVLPIANQVLKESFPELDELTEEDFWSSERFHYPARSIVFRRIGAEGKNFGVELEVRDEGLVNPISVWNGGEARDVEKPLTVRGVKLADVPSSRDWKDMERLRVFTDSGYSFKPEYATYEVAPEVWVCYVPDADSFYIEVGNNQRRRKLYGPIAGNPLQVLIPPPVPAKPDRETTGTDRRRDVSLADLVRDFNAQTEPDRKRLKQPALTPEEVIASVRREKWQSENPLLNELEVQAYREIATLGRLPEYSRFHLETEDATETFVWRRFWRVKLMLPAIGRNGHVGLTIRDTQVAEETIDPKQVAWGNPDVDGLTVGIYFSPRKTQYAIGERVRLRYFVRNGGNRPVTAMWPGIMVPMPEEFTITEASGAKVAVDIGHQDWDSPWTTFIKSNVLDVNDVHGLTVPYEISIGGDGSKSRLIGRVLKVRAGQSVQLKIRAPEVGVRERQSGEPELESGSISFEVTLAQSPVIIPAETVDPTNSRNSQNGIRQPKTETTSKNPQPSQGEIRNLHKPSILLPDHWILQRVEFDRGGNELITASNQSLISVRRWDLVGKRLISEIKLQADIHGRPVNTETFQFSGDRGRLIAATDAYIGIWDSATGQLLKQLPYETKDGIYTCSIDQLDCTPDLSVIVGYRALPGRLTLSYDAHLIVWDNNSGQTGRRIIDKGATDLKAIDLSTDGRRLVTTNGNGAKIWDTRTGELLREIQNDNSGRKHSEPDVSSQYTSFVWSVQFSPNGQQVAIGDILGVKLFETTSGKLLRELEGPYRYSSSGSPGLVFSPDGEQLARLGTQEKVDGDRHRYVLPTWSTKTGLKRHLLRTNANAAAFSEDGQRLAVGFSDMQQALAVWALSDREGDIVETSGPGPHSRVDRVEENGHYVGATSAEYIERFQPTWGEQQHGLEYGIALTTSKRSFRKGERVPFVAFVRNSGDSKIKFNTAPDYFGNTPEVLNSQRERIALENVPLLGRIPRYHETLNPGEALGPFYFSMGLGDDPQPGSQHWHPFVKTPTVGRYSVTHSAIFNITDKKVDVSKIPSRINSGTIEIEIVD